MQGIGEKGVMRVNINTFHHKVIIDNSVMGKMKQLIIWKISLVKFEYVDDDLNSNKLVRW